LSSSQDTVISRRVRYFSYCSMQEAMGHERAFVQLGPFLPAQLADCAKLIRAAAPSSSRGASRVLLVSSLH
jgi:hypothetical protein